LSDLIGFDDRVRIRPAPETTAAGLAGLEGLVYGFSQPSSSGVDVIGERGEDFAFNVHIEEREEAFWLAPHLVELVARAAPGSTFTLGPPQTIEGEDGPIGFHERFEFVLDDDGDWVPVAHRREPLVRRLRRALRRVVGRGRGSV
jgi:hypothetical protein